MPKIEIDAVPERVGGIYPAPFDAVVAKRAKRALGDAGGLDQFGVNLTRLPPGAASALRHWHEAEDEFIYVVEGELVLIEDDGPVTLRPGDAAAFKAGVQNGHHLVNRSDADALYLEIGGRAPRERGVYPDDDILYEKTDGAVRFTNRAGEVLG